MQSQRTETVAVPADKLRAGDVVAICRDHAPDTVIASAEYIGWRSGINSVQIAFEREDGTPYFIRTPGWYTPGTFAPGKAFYVAADKAEAIGARSTAMDAYYASESS